MSQDLTSMIEEINNVSAMLSKTNKPDNPVSVLQASKRISLATVASAQSLVNDANMILSLLQHSSRRLSGCLMGIYRFYNRSMKALQACNQRLQRRRRRAKDLERMGITASGLTPQMISIALLLVGEDKKGMDGTVAMKGVLLL